MIVSFSVLSMSTSDLHVVLIGDGLEVVLFGAKFGELNVDRGSESSSKIGWARSDVAKSLIEGKLDYFLNVLTGSAKTIED
jgi:hypothetical protein